VLVLEPSRLVDVIGSTDSGGLAMPPLQNAFRMAPRHNDREEHLHMGDKGGKKDKAKSKQQHDAKQKAEVKRTQEKNRKPS
jgi:hypothetical protein